MRVFLLPEISENCFASPISLLIGLDEEALSKVTVALF